MIELGANDFLQLALRVLSTQLMITPLIVLKSLVSIDFWIINWLCHAVEARTSLC